MMDSPIPQPIPEPALQPLPGQPVPALVKARTPRSMIVFLLLVFPPIAWIFMALDKTYHHWLIKVLYISGFVSLILLGLFYFSVGVQIDQLYEALGMPNATNKELMYGSMISGATFAALQIFFAFFYDRYLRKHQSLTRFQISIIIILLISAFVIAYIPPLLTLQAVSSFYTGL